MSPSTLFRNTTSPDQALGGSVVARNSAIPQAEENNDALADNSLRLKAKASLHILIQLKAMLEAGVPLLAALRTLIKHAETPASEKAL